MGWIYLRRLRFFAVHGLLPEERRHPQEFWVDVRCQVDFQRAAETDDVADTVNYADIVMAVRSVVEGEPVNLLERLARQVAEAVRAVDRRIGAIEVTITKVRPPFPVDSAGVEVTWYAD